MPDRDAVLQALTSVIDPELHRDVVDLGMVGDIAIDGSHVAVTITLTTPGCPLKANIIEQVQRHVGEVAGVASVQVQFGAMTEAQRAALRDRLRDGRTYRDPGVALPEHCRIVAVTSGKGGVGKSTLTANLAVAMALAGRQVGVLDADVYGYSIPQMLGIQQRPVTVDSMIVPPVNHGVRLMSIGFFLDDDAPVMWRGPMLHRALQQFLGDVHWGDIDYLFVDMPPGTGDIAISLGQMLPRAEVLVVTTPQLAAQRVAQRAALMAGKLDQRVIGVVENMAGAPGAASVFGSGGGQVLAAAVGAPLLATVALDAAVREGGDSGTPVVAVAPPLAVAVAFHDLARAIEAIEPPALPAPEGGKRIKKPLAVL